MLVDTFGVEKGRSPQRERDKDIFYYRTLHWPSPTRAQPLPHSYYLQDPITFPRPTTVRVPVTLPKLSILGLQKAQVPFKSTLRTAWCGWTSQTPRRRPVRAHMEPAKVHSMDRTIARRLDPPGTGGNLFRHLHSGYALNMDLIQIDMTVKYAPKIPRQRSARANTLPQSCSDSSFGSVLMNTALESGMQLRSSRLPGELRSIKDLWH